MRGKLRTKAQRRASALKGVREREKRQIEKLLGEVFENVTQARQALAEAQAESDEDASEIKTWSEYEKRYKGFRFYEKPEEIETGVDY
jgi:hypothetical protein